MGLLWIILGTGTLLYVNHKCSWKKSSPPPDPKEWKLTSYGYGKHQFRASSASEAKTIMDYLDKADAEKERQQALKNLQHCHIWDHRELRCSKCGMDMRDYRSTPPYEQKRCPEAKYEDFIKV